jgi:hypothetical protein
MFEVVREGKEAVRQMTIAGVLVCVAAPHGIVEKVA